MKPRRVILSIEIETAVPLADLRDKEQMAVHVLDSVLEEWKCVYPLQVQANVVKQAAKRKAAK